MTERCNARDDDCDRSIDESTCAACSRHVFEASTYLHCATPTTFDIAASNCASMGYRLATINTADENAFAEGITGEPAWIGLRRMGGSVTWTSGEPFLYQAWFGGMVPSSGECGILIGSFGAWDLLMCDSLATILCEAP